VAYAAFIEYVERFVYNGDTYTKKHYYEQGSSSWNAYVRTEAPRVFNYVGGSYWAQRKICLGAVITFADRGGWANYDVSAMNSAVFPYALANPPCTSERMGIYATHQWREFPGGSIMSNEYVTSRAR